MEEGTYKKKICLVVDSLGKGGAERSSAALSQILFDLNYAVSIISVLDVIDYPYHGTLINLSEMFGSNTSAYTKIQKFLFLKKYIKEQKFDFVIDNRVRPTFLKEYLVRKWVYNTTSIVYVIRSYKLDIYLSSKIKWSSWIYKKTHALVAVSDEICIEVEKTYGFSNVKRIYNSYILDKKVLDEKVTDRPKENKELQSKYILAYGRIDDEVKNYSFLIKAYAASILPINNIKLKIVGSGRDMDKLQLLSKKIGIKEFVEFEGYTSDPFNFVKNALFITLTSRYEGFPRVLLEALSNGVPVVSVNCTSGPKEIVQSEVNGLLVEQDNLEAFVKALDRMILDKKLYFTCKKNATSSVLKFSPENIGKEWELLLH